MIIGIVNADFEPIISLSVCGFDGKVYAQDAIVDTGFNGEPVTSYVEKE